MGNYSIENVIIYSTSLTLGFVAMITNGIIILLAVLNPSLRKHGKCLQVALACSDFVFGFGAIVANIDRLRIIFWNDWYTAYYCVIIYMFSFIGDAFSILLIIMMALERLYAVIWPIRYFTSDHTRSTCLTILISALAAVSFFGISFIGIDNSVKPISCVGTAVRHSLLKPMMSYYNCTFGMVIVILYMSLIIIIRKKTRSLQNMDQDSRVQNAFKREAATTKLVLIIIISCILFLIVPNIVLTILTILNIQHIDKIGPYNSLLSVCNCAINFFLYMWKDEKMRKAFIALFNKKKKYSDQFARRSIR